MDPPEEARGERPPDPVEPLLDPFSTGTKRWIAILWAISAVAWLLAVNGFPPLTINFGGLQAGPFPSGSLRSATWQALVALSWIVVGSAAADMVSVQQRRRLLRIRGAEWEGLPKPPEEHLRNVLLEPTIRPIIASRLGIPLLGALLALAWTLWS